MNFFDFLIYDFTESDTDTLLQNMKGKHQKGITILFSCDNLTFDEAACVDFLSKIFGAIGCDLAADTRYFSVKKGTTYRFSNLNDTAMRHLFVFGLAPSELGVQCQIEPYYSLMLHGTHLFFADNLEKLSQNQAKKRLLWNYLRTTFLNK